ncbi:G2/M phase-specific E3 ubiquitin-protein ligase-like [Haliotis rufescens]|uniref:G2/M phase-specific E3 ubiquitin-protein ligase-like n=1 Tax=Haliotis rufescens TaxID=6454 RepID=UPI00201F0DC2|nr:G2/M phase-specific E3 ubiquitin-protein ligase-like [Haliotis rufescens]XP_048238922.1 G2/M phase-specific E3 ubiquitin-protein ligase-like [Haliotis rufescens]
MDKDLYFIVGVLISLSLAHGGAPPRIFSEKMYSWITQGPSFIKSSIVLADLPRGTDIYEKLHRVNNANNLDELQAAAGEMSSFLEVAGCSIILQDMKDKERLVRACVQFYMVDRVQSCMTRFLEGLSTLGVLETVRKQQSSCSDLFCKSVDNLGLDTVTELFKPVLNPEGTNRRRKEVSTLAYWSDYLSDVKEGESRLQFSDILMFDTGSESIPPCGFDTNPRLEFLPDSPNMRYPTANTCSCILRLPVSYDEYSEFKENFELQC